MAQDSAKWNGVKHFFSSNNMNGKSSAKQSCIKMVKVYDLCPV